ncbi:MAG: retropepsin-like aspartic protease [Gammaproteobacteria bacterium]|nr:retropepsin-like aspartic protease [Gammaproteobacteria bacterium]
MIKSWFLAAIILLNVQTVWSDELQIVVVGLFADHAVVEINNKQRILSVGKTSPEGVKLISATSQKAVLEIKGKQSDYVLGSHIGAHYTPPVAQPVVNIWPTNGMYLTAGSINGYSVNFIVDTGASSIALNADTAKRLGLEYLKAPQIAVKTASKVEIAYQVKLEQVQVGTITLYNVDGLVIDGSEPSVALLGMSFLGQLDMQRTDNKLQLKKKF